MVSTLQRERLHLASVSPGASPDHCERSLQRSANPEPFICCSPSALNLELLRSPCCPPHSDRPRRSTSLLIPPGKPLAPTAQLQPSKYLLPSRNHPSTPPYMLLRQSLQPLFPMSRRSRSYTRQLHLCLSPSAKFNSHQSASPFASPIPANR